MEECKMKKIMAALLALSLLAGSLVGVSGTEKKAQAASSYWLYGTALTKSQGGEAGCRIKMYYRGGKLVVQGGMRQGKKKADYGVGKKIKSKTRKFKVASNCKVVECEGLEEYSYGIKSYVKERGIGSKKNWAGISTRIKVVKGKVAKIYLSA